MFNQKCWQKIMPNYMVFKNLGRGCNSPPCFFTMHLSSVPQHITFLSIYRVYPNNFSNSALMNSNGLINKLFQFSNPVRCTARKLELYSQYQNQSRPPIMHTVARIRQLELVGCRTLGQITLKFARYINLFIMGILDHDHPMASLCIATK